MVRLVVNVILFQAGWFACVLAGATNRPMLGVAAAAAVVAFHLASARRAAPETGLILIVTLLGMIFDSLLAASGWLVYASPVPVATAAPIWIVALWACFATTLNVSLRWLRARSTIAALLGVVGGPLAYLAGASLGGVEIIDRGAALLALGAGWAITMPLVVRLAERLDGWPRSDQRSATITSPG